jgi:hypothetical protein
MLHCDEDARACGAVANQQAATSNQAAVSTIVSLSSGFRFLVAGIRSPLSLAESLF